MLENGVTHCVCKLCVDVETEFTLELRHCLTADAALVNNLPDEHALLLKHGITLVRRKLRNDDAIDVIWYTDLDTQSHEEVDPHMRLAQEDVFKGGLVEASSQVVMV